MPPVRPGRVIRGVVPQLGAWLVRCAAVAGGVILAWLLASEVASASEATEVAATDAPASSLLGRPGGSPIDGTAVTPASAAAIVDAVPGRWIVALTRTAQQRHGPAEAPIDTGQPRTTPD